MRWWTLENSTGSATLAARLATTLGVLVVARFFLETPQISYAVTNTYRIDREVLAEGFSATGQQVPDYAVEIADIFDARYEHDFLSFYDRYWPINVGTAGILAKPGDTGVIIQETYSGAQVPSLEADIDTRAFLAAARLYAFSPDDPYESFYVAAQSLAEETDEAETARVAAALTNAIVSRVSVTLSNPSRVKATDVAIDPPDDLVVVQALPSSESISAGEQYEVIYAGDPGTVLQKQADDFSVDWNEAGILNTGLLIAIGFLMFVFWFFTTVKAIAQYQLDE